MKNNVKRSIALIFAVIFVCMSLCSCEESIAKRYSRYDRGGERYDYDLLEYIAMPEYRGIEVPLLEYTPTSEDVDNTRIKKLVYFSEEEVIPDGTIEKYDLVDCDFVTLIDGYEYRSLCSSSNSALRSVLVGIEEFDIPEIDECLLGMKPGETATIEFVFPEPYYRDPLVSGCKAEFTVTIDQIRRQNFAEYTDEFVSQYYGATDTETYDSEIESQLINDYSNYLKDYKKDMTWEYLVSNTKLMKLPGKEYRELFNLVIDSYVEEAEAEGLTVDDYAVQVLGYENTDVFYEDMANDVQSTIMEEMILYVVARCENIVLTVSEYEEALLQATSDLEIEDLTTCEQVVAEQYGSLSNFKEAVLFSKIFDYISENVTELSIEEYYANKHEGKYENVELEESKSLSVTEILIIVGIAVAVLLVIVTVILAVNAVKVKKIADIKAKERAELEEKRRIRREQKQAKKKHYGKKPEEKDE